VSDSPQGRRILVARVTGEAAERVKAWRLRHDAEQAQRLPPHATLCYWAPAPVHLPALSLQVGHAFDEPVRVVLGDVREFPNAERTFYVEVLETEGLDRARQRLFDGRYVQLEGRSAWTWHVTCVRASADRADIAELRAAARDFQVRLPWHVDRVSYMELRAERYELLHEWQVGVPSPKRPG
jgi:hypothetical protein